MSDCAYKDCGSPLPRPARFCPRCGRRVRRGGARFLVLTLAIAMPVAAFVLVGTRASVGGASATSTRLVLPEVTQPRYTSDGYPQGYRPPRR